FNHVTYILLQNGYDPKGLEAKLDGFLKNYIGLIMKAAKIELHNFLQPLDSIHLQSNLLAELSQNGDIKYIYVFSGVGLLILIIACINFMNLSTARSAKRAKEVGMRKVMGAERRKLFNQFIGESLSLAVISLFIALIFVELTLPFFNSMAAVDLEVNYFSDPAIFFSLLGITLVPGLLAGIYPALVLSGFRPVQVLKSGLMRKGKHSGFRSVLVVSQFSISIALIIGTGIIFNQLDFLKNKELGFSDEHVLVLQFDYQIPYERIITIKKEMMDINGVINTSAAKMVPGEDSFNTSSYFPEGRSMSESVLMENFSIDPDFVETLGIEIIEGRDLSGEISSDPGNAILINETAMKKLGWKRGAGKSIREMINTKYQLRDQNVVGVIKDIHQRSLHKKIEPLILDFKPDNYRRIIIKLRSDDLTETVNLIEKKWNEIESGKPFEHFFLDESFNMQYRNEERLGNIIRAFTVFALFIGCLGLFGLASFTTEQRTKEIGVRKVLGSNVISIVYLLCREFVLLILLANAIAWPAAYFAVKYWLNNFPYQTPLTLNLFISAGLIALGIAVLTVSYQSIKAAFSNPINSLRYE
ncbi:MAG: FtsX-like permease family protein, partial [bacterium]|nr:FtsX-like permease family protein [bacterium]